MKSGQGRMKLQRLSALTIRVREMTRAIAFYNEILGLEVLYTPGRRTVKLELVRSGHKPLNPPVVRTVTFTMTDGIGRQREE
jgi:catechol 2,3-dioxygenase-like lactoylglutathione lyase family enzyme